MAITTTGVRYDLIARDSASRQFNNVGNSASRLERGFGKLGKAAVVLGGALAVGVGAALGESAKKAVEFQTSMLKIQTQAGATAKDVGILSKQVLALGKTTQQGPQQLSEALYHLKSVGMDNVDAMKALKTASDLAAVGGSNLESTTNALAGAWRTGIKGATSMSEAAKTLNATIGAGNMSMDDMVAALGTGILPTAKTFGLTLSQVGSALALFTDEGIDSASAATRLRMSISLLGAPSAAAEKWLGKIKLSGNQLGNAMRGPDGIIGAITLLKDHLDKSGLSATQSAALLSHAFGGGKSSSAILSMINNLDVLKKKQIQVNDGMSKYGPAVTAQRKTVQAQFNLIKSNLQVTEIELGDKLLPVLSKVVVYINKTALPGIGMVSSKLTSMVPVAKIKSDFAAVTQGVTDFFSGFSPKTAKKKTIVLPSPTIKAPTTSIPGYLQKTPTLTVPSPTIKVPTTKIPSSILAPKPVQSQAQKMGAQLRAALAGGLGDAVKGLDWGKLGGQLGKGLDSAFGWLAKHTGSIGKKIGAAIGSIDWVNVGKTLGNEAIPLVVGFLDNMFTPLFKLSFWKKHWWDAIIAVVSVIPFDEVFTVAGELIGKLPWGKLGEIIGDSLGKIPWGKSLDWATWIGKTAGDAKTAVGHFLSMLSSGFTEGFSRIFPKIGQRFSEELLLLPTRIGDAGRALITQGKLLVNKLGDAIVNGVPGMKNKFLRAIVKYFGRYSLYQAGTQLVEGLYGGIVARLDKVGSWLKANVVDPVVHWTKSLFGIHSPSTVFAGIGGQLISGLYHGISGAISGVGKWLHSHVISPITSTFSGAGSWLYGKGSSLISGLKSGITGAMAGSAKWVYAHVQSPLVGALSKPATWLYGKGKDVITGFFSGLKEPWADVQKWVSGVASWIKAHKGPISLDRKLLVPAGKALMGGLLSGLKVGFKGVGSFIHKTGTTVASTVSDITSKIGMDLTGGGSSATSGANQALGKRMMLAAGFQADQWPWLKMLWNQESGWRTNAKNPSSGAYGIPQALPASKMGSAGKDWRTNPATQIAWGLAYIKGRYGTPGFAMAHERSYNWYDRGGVATGKGFMAKNTLKPERVLSPRQTASFDRLASVLARPSGQQQIPVMAAAPRGGAQVVHNHYDQRTENNTSYTIQPQRAEFTTRDLEAVQRRSEARQRVGRAR